jgi:hypothetical protein
MGWFLGVGAAPGQARVAGGGDGCFSGGGMKVFLLLFFKKKNILLFLKKEKQKDFSFWGGFGTRAVSPLKLLQTDESG